MVNNESDSFQTMSPSSWAVFWLGCALGSYHGGGMKFDGMMNSSVELKLLSVGRLEAMMI